MGMAHLRRPTLILFISAACVTVLGVPDELSVLRGRHLGPGSPVHRSFYTHAGPKLTPRVGPWHWGESEQPPCGEFSRASHKLEVESRQAGGVALWTLVLIGVRSLRLTDCPHVTCTMDPYGHTC